MPPREGAAQLRGADEESDGLSLAGFAARLAVKIGLTLHQACEHSLPQLRLLAEAAERERASQMLIHMQSAAAAIGGYLGGREGGAQYQKIIAMLSKDDQRGASESQSTGFNKALPSECKANRRMIAASFKTNRPPL